ncbi:MAG: PQQ-like beta-propeller repeat protein [Planctomycetaceae bacterium]|nr:PQQ-like beta-propeller repeat protein [Planctomycetaceae bacterium]
MTTSMRFLAPALLFLFVTTAFAADWTMFHGPDGKNQSAETGLLTAWSPDGPKLLWKIGGIGDGYSGWSTVTIQNGRLFTTGNRDKRSIVFCFDLDGKPLWDYDNGPAWTGNYVGTRSTPTVDGEFVYDLSPHGELVCLKVGSAESPGGEKVWSRNILTDFDGENIIWGISESIRIDGDRLYCSPGGAKASFVALNKHTGETIWTTPSLGEKTSYGSPIIFEYGGLRIITTTYAKGMFGVNAANGDLLFQFQHRHHNDILATRPIYHDGHLFLTNNTFERVGQGAVMHKLSVADGKVSLEEVWRNRTFDNLHDSVILLDGFLYGSSSEYRGGAYMCVDWKTGETRYEVKDVSKGSLTWAEGLIYFLSEQREVVLIRPNPEKYDVISQFELPDDGEGLTWAHPVICGKRLYIRHGTFLYCYDIAR